MVFKCELEPLTLGTSILDTSHADQGAISDIYTGHKYRDNATSGVAVAINSGCDVNDGTPYAESLPGAVAANLVNASRIAEAAARFLKQRFRVGSFDPPSKVPWTSVPASVANSPAHQAVALQAAEQSIVLLNNSAGVLPITLKPQSTLAIIGPFGNCTLVSAAPDTVNHFLLLSVAYSSTCCRLLTQYADAIYPTYAQCLGGGKTDYQNSGYITYLAGLQAHPLIQKLGVRVEYAMGSRVNANDSTALADAVQLATRPDVALVLFSVGIDATIEHEGTDRTAIGVPQAQLELVQAVTRALGDTPAVAILTNGGPLSCTWIRDHIPTLVEAFEGGQFAGPALASVLLGEVNPSGVLPFSVFPEGYVDAVSMTDMSM